MEKISHEQYLQLVRDPDIDDDEIVKYSKIVPGKGGLAFELRADPEKVDLRSEDLEFESAIRIGNEISRFRRQARFRRRRFFGSDLPVLVAEGDSWFQFPFLIREVIDQLGDSYLIWSLGAAGDTAENMVFGGRGTGRSEYMKALREHKDVVQGFLFSAAGNDIIGEHPETQIPVLFDLLKPFNGNATDVDGHIDQVLLKDRLDFLRTAYGTVIDSIRSEPGFETLPIFIHGYDYVFPYPWGPNDRRNPIYAARDEWLGGPLNKREISDQSLRRDILKRLIDRLYTLLAEISGDPTETGVWLVDCRNAMDQLSDWNDEIHGTSAGFSKVAQRFKSVIDAAIPGRAR